MFYVGNKKVKEIVVKGSDNFLHRVRAGVLNNKYFYLTNPQNSELVDVVVNYSGERTKTTPQMVKKSELGSTTIRLNDISSQYELMVSASSPGYDCVNSFSSTSKTLTLKPDTTKSTVTLNLVKKSNMISTNSIALMIADNPFIDSYSHGSFQLENALVYARDSHGQYQQVPVTEIQVTPGVVEFFPTFNPNIDTQAMVHFGFLSKSAAESLGFSATDNPDGTSKECSAYYGWGCWTDAAWLWSDRELQEIFSIGDDIRAEDNWDDLLQIGAGMFHWGIYDLDPANLSSLGVAGETFTNAWIVAADPDNQPFVFDVSRWSFDDIYSIYLEGAEFSQLQLVVPFSQQLPETYKSLQNLDIIQSQQEIIDNYFGTIGGISINAISGDYQFSLSQNNNNLPYVYAGDFSTYVQLTYYDQGGILSGFTTYSVSNGFLYLGSVYPEASSIDITTDTSVDTSILGAVHLGYKLIPLITSSGTTTTNGTIGIYD